MRYAHCRMNRGVLLAGMLLVPVRAWAAEPAWTGNGGYRVLVRVDPVNIGGRLSDELVARFSIAFGSVMGPGAQADLATLQVHKYDLATGGAEAFVPFDNAVSLYDRPCRFDDNAVPTMYPDRVGYASNYADGRPPITLRERGGRLFNREMDNSAGSVVWVHTQNGMQASYYAIYWDGKGAGTTTGPSPSPWIGDVDVYRRETGQPLGGFAHFTAATGDLNGDGLFDIIAGVEKGDLMWFPNRGSPGSPAFRGCRMVTDELGPIDLGWYSAPFLFDWDDDGRLDLIVGTSHNAIIWWKNAGTAASPAFTYRGFVRADGARLAVPQSPVPEDISGSFTVDYYNQPWVGDWNGDGLPDILTGGYTTGRVFFYRCTGRDAQGVPILTYAGPVEADGQPLDTGWAAAPTAGDFTNDGILELMSGSWAFGQPVNPSDYLMYYRNLATPQAPNYARAVFPKIGNFPSGVIARASVVDWNGDVLKDLLVSDNNGAVRAFPNEGSASNPNWNTVTPSLTGAWGFVKTASFMSVADWDNNGEKEFLARSTIYAMEGSAYSPRQIFRGTATVDGGSIFIPGPGYGDAYNWDVFADWDINQKMDILTGTQQGNLYFHRNLGAVSNLVFDNGIKLTLSNGQDLKVGPPVYEDPNDVPDFTALQGSRMIMAVADFDTDGIQDVAIAETYGNIWIFRNTVEGGTNTLAPGVIVYTGARLDGLDVVDWNNDQKPDLITGLSVNTPGAIFINQSTPGSPSFAAPIYPLGVPFVFWGPIFSPTDWNDDGDEDFLIRSEFYLFWAERSFIDHGYIEAAPLSGGGWTATFDAGADGVEYIEHSSTRDMIGTATGGVLPITVVNAASSEDYNRAGRPLGRTIGYRDTVGGAYRFSWSQLYTGSEQSGWGSVEFAGFLGDSGGQMFRQMAGALLQHRRIGSNYHIKLGIMAGAGTENGFTPDSLWYNLGAGALGTTYVLAIDYDGTSHMMTLSLRNAGGTVLRSMSADLDGLLSSDNLEQLALTHLGWSDYSGSIGAWNQINIPYVWQVDSLEYHDSVPGVEIQIGACCDEQAGACTDEVTALACLDQGFTFLGVGTTCAESNCASICPIPFADADRDGDVDQTDYAAFQLCVTGQDDPTHVFDSELCGCFDRDFGGTGDEDVDRVDFDLFYGCMSGANVIADPLCAE